LLRVLSKSERLCRYCFFLAALCLTGVGSAASARIDETRIGIVEPIDGPPGDKFGAPDINVEVLFGRFGPEYQSSILNYFLRPRLDFGTSISTEGDTSEFYAGLTWDVFLTRRLFLEGSAGGALHNGDNRDFGCTANFRESGSIGVMLSERWDMLATVDHMSDANLCDENRGLTQVGIRFGRKW
jgi:lipid A 3-O-deacylase